MPSLSTLPNARFQPLGMAGARHEQRLFPVGCKPLLGCWRPTQVPGPPGDRLPRPPRAPPRRRMPPRPVGRGRPPGSPMPPVACLALLGHGADVLPCPPPAPAESPHAAQETPPLSWRRTRRHVTMPRPCPWWRCRDTSHRHAPWSQHGRTSTPSHPAAGAWGHHDGLAHLRVPEPPSQRARGQRAARVTARPPQRIAPDAGPGIGGHRLLVLWATPGNHAARSNPTTVSPELFPQ